jgi:hypothetical protein
MKRQLSSYDLIKQALVAKVELLDCDVSMDNRRRILIQCALYTNPRRDTQDDGLCSYEWITRPETIAADLGIGRSTVHRFLQACIEQGWMTVVDKGQRGGRHRESKPRRLRAVPSFWQGLGFAVGVNGQAGEPVAAGELVEWTF